MTTPPPSPPSADPEPPSGPSATSEPPTSGTAPSTTTETNNRTAAPSTIRRERRFALLVALIAAAAGIGGAAVGAIYTNKASYSQLHSAAILAERQERKEADGKLIIALYDLNNQAHEYIKKVEHYSQSVDPRDREAINNQYYGKYFDAFVQWNHEWQVIEILVPKSVLKPIAKLVELENNLDLVAADLNSSDVRESWDSKSENRINEFHKLENDIVDAKNELV